MVAEYRAPWIYFLSTFFILKWSNYKNVHGGGDVLKPTSISLQSVRPDDKNAFVETLSFLLCRFWLKQKLDIQQIQRFVWNRFSYFNATNIISNERKINLSNNILQYQLLKERKRPQFQIFCLQIKNIWFENQNYVNASQCRPGWERDAAQCQRPARV